MANPVDEVYALPDGYTDEIHRFFDTAGELTLALAPVAVLTLAGVLKVARSHPDLPAPARDFCDWHLRILAYVLRDYPTIRAAQDLPLVTEPPPGHPAYRE